MAYGPVIAPQKLKASDVDAAASNHTHSLSSLGAVPTTRKVNGKALSADISLTASDVEAAASNHTHSGYASSSHTHSQYAASNHTHSDYAPKASPVFTGSLSLNRKAGTTVGAYSVAEGYHCEAVSYGAHAEGYYTIANGSGAHAEGASSFCISFAGGHAEGVSTIAAVGHCYIPLNRSKGTGKEIFVNLDSTIPYLSSALSKVKKGMTLYTRYAGNDTAPFTPYEIESVDTSQGKIVLTQDPGQSHQFEDAVIPEILEHDISNWNTLSHAEGYQTKALGPFSHAEGERTRSIDEASHAEGYYTEAFSRSSHAEGEQTKALGEAAHAEGNGTIASGLYSHAEGSGTTASGGYSHAEGSGTTASYYGAHAEGGGCIASGFDSHAGGNLTIAAASYQTAIGRYNKESALETDKFIIGKGTSETARSNCFRVTHTGVFASGNYNSSGADYAPMFEWADGNPDQEDRVGRFVTLKGEKIRLANPEDKFIVGIVSGNPAFGEDVQDDQWQGMYLQDIYGRPIWEDVEVPAVTKEVEMQMPAVHIEGAAGTQTAWVESKKETVIIIPAHMERRQKLNPNYDSSQEYIPRSERPEWDFVGILGKLVVIDDGTCQIDGWAKPAVNGIATASETETKYRVMARLDETHIRVLAMRQ